MRFILTFPSFISLFVLNFKKSTIVKFAALLICFSAYSAVSFGQQTGARKFIDAPVTPPDTSKNTLLVPIRDSSNSGSF